MKIDIECRNCNKYLKVKKENAKYKCPNCAIEEDLVVIDKEYIKKRADK